MPTVKSIAYKPKDKIATDETGVYVRRVINEANLVEGYGIEGDRKGGHPKRQLNVMDAMTLAELAKEGYPITPGTLGENIILSGMDLRKLPRGTQLRIGNEAVIELGKLREPCENLTGVDERMPDTVVDRVGVMCRVVKSGRVKIGDAVEIVTAPINAQEPVKNN